MLARPAFESNQIGTTTLDKQPDNSFKKEVFIPVDPSNYPVIAGNITVYDGAKIEAELPISFSTTYNISINSYTVDKTNEINIFLNISLSTGLGPEPLSDSEVFTKIYRNSALIKTIYFSKQDYIENSIYSMNVNLEESGMYILEIYLLDGLELNPMKILDVGYSIESESSGDSDHESNLEQDYDEEIQYAIPIIISFIAIPSSVIVISSKYKQKSRVKSIPNKKF